MRILVLSIILTFCLNAAAETLVDAVDSSPLWGTWSWKTSKHCTVTYTFTSEGLLHVKNGAKRTDNEYQVTRREKIGQFATLNLKTIKDYGGIGCDGIASAVTGQSRKRYFGIVNRPDHSEMVNCETPDGKGCRLLKKIEYEN